VYKSSTELLMVHKTPESKQETTQIFINGCTSLHEFSTCNKRCWMFLQRN